MNRRNRTWSHQSRWCYRRFQRLNHQNRKTNLQFPKHRQNHRRCTCRRCTYRGTCFRMHRSGFRCSACRRRSRRSRNCWCSLHRTRRGHRDHLRHQNRWSRQNPRNRRCLSWHRCPRCRRRCRRSRWNHRCRRCCRRFQRSSRRCRWCCRRFPWCRRWTRRFDCRCSRARKLRSSVHRWPC